MHTTLFDVHPQTDSRTLLRQMDVTCHIRAQRKLSKAEVESFIAQVKKDYAITFSLHDTPKRKALGQRLYAWLDGPSQRWLANWRSQYPNGWALHIDVLGSGGGEKIYDKKTAHQPKNHRLLDKIASLFRR
ncbi:MAG: hypothetical protein WCL57_10700 [Chloroflexota bacterium]